MERRKEKITVLKNNLEHYFKSVGLALYNPTGIDELDLDDLLDEGYDDTFNVDFSKVDVSELRQAIDIELTSITPLLKKANALLFDRKDLKIVESIELANRSLNDNDKVLVFSRYTDTIDALINIFHFYSGLSCKIVTNINTITIHTISIIITWLDKSTFNFFA